MTDAPEPAAWGGEGEIDDGLKAKAVSISISIEEYNALRELHRRCRVLSERANKSTPFRAGLRYILSLDDEQLREVLADTPSIPRGPRPR